MADKSTEKPEATSPVVDAQEATAADPKPAEPAPAEDETAKGDGDDTKATEG